MFNIGPLELLMILIVALLVVGPRRLPEVGRTIGRSLREFRRASEEVRRSIELDLDEEPPVHEPTSTEPRERPDARSDPE
jgi:Tat protein translocase TatB subunit